MFRSEEFENSLKKALKSKDYVYLEPMNKGGGWGEIFYVVSQEDKEVRVVKVYKEPIGRITEEIYKSDAKKLMEINHPNVVKYFDKGIMEYDNKSYFFLILEFIKGITFDELESGLFFETEFNKRLDYFIQTLNGINEFRVNFQLHRDLHSGNIILSDENINGEREIKIIDPGTSRYFYDPGDEDIDLFSIKEELINLFFSQEELKNINAATKIYSLNFPELRDFFINLSLNYLDGDEIEENLQNIRTHNQTFFQQLTQDIYELNKNQLEDSSEELRYMMIGTSITPLSDKKQILDFDDEKTDTKLIDLHRNFSIGSPGGPISSFGNLLTNIIYQRDEYIAKFERTGDYYYNKTEHRISRTGRVLSTIIIHSRSGSEFLKKETYFYEETKEKDLLQGSHIYSGLIAYLLMMLLKLAREIYNNQFSGQFLFSMHVISPFPIFITKKIPVKSSGI